MVKRENDNSPKHNYLIGLAYLNGVDVEVDHERALSLITSSADAGYIDAMEKLFDMYESGVGVALDFRKAAVWAEKVYNYYFKNFGEEDKKHSRLFIT